MQPKLVSKRGRDNKSAKLKSGPSTVTCSNHKLIEHCGIPATQLQGCPLLDRTSSNQPTKLCEPLLAMGMWVLQFAHLHNTTAISEKLTGRLAACHERLRIIIVQPKPKPAATTHKHFEVQQTDSTVLLVRKLPARPSKPRIRANA